MALLPALLGGPATLQAAPPVYPAPPATPVLAQVTDHGTRAQARLLAQYIDKPRMVALLGAFTGRTAIGGTGALAKRLNGAWVCN